MKNETAKKPVQAVPAAGDAIAGFRIEEVVPLPDLRATAVRARHLGTGARLLHIHAAGDGENAFAVTFPTTPPDNTGLPHILEHAVLGGSRKYPLREPFFEMVKTSMATFINAMTAPGYTAYPVASNVKRDFFNLVDVYLDAVFHPTLSEEIFRREGHHLTLANNADLSSPLTVFGIVFSEMKGAYSAPESLLYRIANEKLLPDTPFARDSGGDPEKIPGLTYDRFLRYYRASYHPAHALFYVYGDIPTADHLRALAPVLDGFSSLPGAAAGHSDLPLRQPRWNAPRRVEGVYPIGSEENAAGRTFLELSWLVGDALDADQATDWDVLTRLLTGHDGAPLKKALVDSHLGAEVFNTGSWAAAFDREFHVGLKGSEPDRADAFERLAIETLRRVADTPFAAADVNTAFRQLAYDALEVKTLFPLHLLDGVNTTWPHGGDPLAFLHMRRLLDASRQRHAADPLRFNRLLREGLVDNAHRLLVALRPDREAQARADAAFAAVMADRRAHLSPAEIAAVAQSAAALQAAQGVPNSPEAVARLPQLRISDLPSRPRRIPTTIGTVAGFTVLRNEVFSNGIDYLEADVDLAGMPESAYAGLARLADLFTKFGAAGRSFAAVAERRAACTGGLWAYPEMRRHATDPARVLRRFHFGVKTLDEQAGDAWGLLSDLVFAADPSDAARLRDVLAQAHSSLRTALLNDGLRTVRRHAGRLLSPEAAIENGYAGTEALRTLDRQVREFDRHVGELAHELETLRDFLHMRARWTFSFTGSDAAFRALTTTLEAWRGRMRDAAVADRALPFSATSVPVREGLAAPLAVAHCARLIPAPHLAHPDQPLFRLGIYLAQFGLLLPEIRLKGNAYGAFGVHDDALGVLALQSYRDPRIVETLRVLSSVRDWIGASRWSQADVERAIIGSMKEMDKPIRPGEATAAALSRHIRGDTDEARAQRYAAALAATPDAVRETTVRILDAGAPQTVTCVIAGRDGLEEANRALGAEALAVSDLLP